MKSVSFLNWGDAMVLSVGMIFPNSPWANNAWISTSFLQCERSRTWPGPGIAARRFVSSI